MADYTLSTDSKQTNKYPAKILNSSEFIEEVNIVFKNIVTLYINNRTLFKKLVQMDLLYTYFPDEQHSDDYWNEQTCCEISKLFTKTIDFQKCYQRCFEIALDNSWILEYTWIVDRNLRPYDYWTFERCEILLKVNNYKSRDEFNAGAYLAYKAAKDNNWLDILMPTYVWNKKWKDNKELCYELALTCHSITEMQAKSNKAAKYARENGWVKDYTWFNKKEDELKKYTYCVYVYTDGIAAYIGLTRNYRIKIRDYEHRKGKNGYHDSLKRYFDKIHKEIPEPVILKNDLTAKEAQYYEDYYRKEYEKNGYQIINIAKTGVGCSSIGVKYPKYPQEYCEDIARKYTTLTDFANNETAIYNASRLHGWLKDYTWLVRQEQEIVSYEEAYEAAKKYKYFGDFATKSQRQYNAAYKRGWLKDYTWLKYKTNRNYERPKPSREECFENAKKFDKAKQFYNHKTTMCKYAREQGWYYDYIWFESVYRYWSSTRCEEEARKYKTLKNFEENCYGGYHVSVKEGWISKFDWLT